MDVSRWNQIQELFEAIADLSTEEQRAYLDIHCQDDELKKEVLQLVQADEHVDDILPKQYDIASADATLVLPKMHPGVMVGPYKIVRKIGEGGMGWVYKAEDTRLERFVALKCLAPEVATDERVRFRLMQEAKAISRLDHPNVCVIHDVGAMSDGGMYIAMQYYSGETLENALTKGALAPDQVVRIAKQIAYGLQAAHQRDIIHRDIKPANILLSEDGIVKILDFGIAKLSGVDITLGGARMGTLRYMSPEQLQGRDMGPQTDVWSVATLIYEMLTGREMFDGEKSSTVLHAVMHEEPEYNLAVFQEYPLFKRLLTAMLHKKPEKRLDSMSKVLQWLTTIQPIAQAGAKTRARQEQRIENQEEVVKEELTDLYLLRLAAALTAHVGPAAPKLIQRYASTSDNREILINSLVGHIKPQYRQIVSQQLKEIAL
ncbi:serine/threonine-protein kinase [Hahella aquimaris]|uniref:serine/threonine protein kinase n=1 Tax=Hahella sp. HNIBRBA332 TaxID=3015983 RepID=UPI00273B5DBA|nr:serine/threonine-protein kinase [Hahella sp. HNIBRBA332]WLQ14961.1 serine/threonine-protein kinase [Hahella sp. HNIBRBA332]